MATTGTKRHYKRRSPTVVIGDQTQNRQFRFSEKAVKTTQSERMSQTADRNARVPLLVYPAVRVSELTYEAQLWKLAPWLSNDVRTAGQPAVAHGLFSSRCPLWSLWL